MNAPTDLFGPEMVSAPDALTHERRRLDALYEDLEDMAENVGECPLLRPAGWYRLRRQVADAEATVADLERREIA